ncbi:hypothetical protein GCK32_021872, partial [Trichostrongylus colubriformis]
FYWINDVMICVPPFCLVMLSAELRNDIVNFIWTRRNVFIMIFAQYIVGFAAFTHVIGTEAIYTRNDDGTFTFVGLEASTNL